MTEKDERKNDVVEIPVQFGDEEIEPVKAEEEPAVGEEGSEVVAGEDGQTQSESAEEKSGTEPVTGEQAGSEATGDGDLAPKEDFIEDYEERIDELENRIAELEAQLRAEREAKLRFAAEAENTKRRAQKDMEHTRFAIRRQLLQDFLPVLDHLEMAVSHADTGDEEGAKAVIEGVKMVIKEFQQALEKHGVEVIDALGKKFDPSVHEAMGQEERDDVEPDTVVVQWQKGYRIGDKLIRPARVVVAKAPSRPKEGEEAE